MAFVAFFLALIGATGTVGVAPLLLIDALEPKHALYPAALLIGCLLAGVCELREDPSVAIRCRRGWRAMMPPVVSGALLMMAASFGAILVAVLLLPAALLGILLTPVAAFTRRRDGRFEGKEVDFVPLHPEVTIGAEGPGYRAWGLHRSVLVDDAFSRLLARCTSADGADLGLRLVELRDGHAHVREDAWNDDFLIDAGLLHEVSYGCSPWVLFLFGRGWRHWLYAYDTRSDAVRRIDWISGVVATSAGDRIAYVRGRSLVVRDLAEESGVVVAMGRFGDPALSPDGRRLVVTRNGIVHAASEGDDFLLRPRPDIPAGDLEPLDTGDIIARYYRAEKMYRFGPCRDASPAPR